MLLLPTPLIRTRDVRMYQSSLECISTIFCEANTDTCNKKIILSWNSYPSQPKIVTGYSLMHPSTEASYSEEALTVPGITDFTIDDFITDATYCFFVRANLEDGSISTSNKTCVVTRMQRPPGWINADYATVSGESGIMLPSVLIRRQRSSISSLKKKPGSPGCIRASGTAWT